MKDHEFKYSMFGFFSVKAFVVEIYVCFRCKVSHMEVFLWIFESHMNPLRTQTPVPFFLNMLGLSEESNRQESNPHVGIGRYSTIDTSLIYYHVVL